VNQGTFSSLFSQENHCKAKTMNGSRPWVFCCNVIKIQEAGKQSKAKLTDLPPKRGKNSHKTSWLEVSE
jgi:hypothetical protein